ncbi:MAG: Fur family ferric uptake transcriptional regulator [Lentimonas sp.]|jgi:Fur family ferric uptake transcriptional regulator
MAQTQQREVIFSVLQDEGRPLTREEILSLGRRTLPRLGSATVDRAIREMTASFQVVGLEFPGQPRRYELPAVSEHPHFICRVCERVFDLPVAMQLPVVKAPKGFLITGGEIIYSGQCPECLKQSPRSGS